MELSRRQFGFAGLATLAFGGLASRAYSQMPPSARNEAVGYGALVEDPNRLIDLPQGFAYRVLSRFGNVMDDGHVVPDAFDGMGCFALPDGNVALVRNHELTPRDNRRGPFKSVVAPEFPAFDRIEAVPIAGGTSTLVIDPRTGARVSEYLSLSGTIRNCAGGITPWGSWLSCEENVSRAGQDGLTQDHGWVFEVPAAHKGLVDPVPLKGLGRFNHEAAAVDPATGIVYLTEDRKDGLLYRFLPAARGELAKGGKLQALALDMPDSRNWEGNVALAQGQWADARWIDLDGPDAPDDDLRMRGAAAGATLFARGEGIWSGTNDKSETELFFACTSGGAADAGQIFRYVPGRREGQRGAKGKLQLFYESRDKAFYNYGDNLTIMPTGHILVCEDQYTDLVDNHLRVITPEGRAFAFARGRTQSELAGCCFSPDGTTLFVNFYSPGATLAITGPWGAVSNAAVEEG